LTDPHILNDQRIDTYLLQLMNHFFGFRQFLVVKNRIESHINLRPVGMGKIHQGLDVLQGIGSSGSGAEFWRTDVNGISPMQNSLNT
jgi:hypothetical protein